MEKINFYTQSSLNDTPELRMVIDVSGNVGIGESNPTKTLEVVGDISFNGSLYQNGALFTGGSTIDETTDVSLNNLIVHGDLSANDVSFNVIDATSLRINGVDIIDGAPEALNTLNELATALDNSANFATNVLTTLSNKQDTLTAGTNITITGNTISASGGGGGGLTDLSATSISDLSDVSFNSTTTSNGATLSWNTSEQLWKPSNTTSSIGVNMVYITSTTYNLYTAPTTVPGVNISEFNMVITPTASDSIIELKYNVGGENDENTCFRITRNISGTDVLLVPATNQWEGAITVPNFDNHDSTTPQITQVRWYDEPGTTLPITYKLWFGSSSSSYNSYRLALNGNISNTYGDVKEKPVSSAIIIEHPKTKTLVPVTSITKQGQVLETLAGVCDGRSVTVKSGTYTLQNVTTLQSLSATRTTATGSEIDYKPPPGTKQVIYEFTFSSSTDDMDDHGIQAYLDIDGTECTNQRRMVNNWRDYANTNVLKFVINIGDTDDLANAKVSSWNTTKTLAVKVREHIDPALASRLHTAHQWTTGDQSGLDSSTGRVTITTSNISSYLFKPSIRITAIGESDGQAVTLTNNSVSDLSDISFNSTTTTDGQALVWNSTNAVWEAGSSSPWTTSSSDIYYNSGNAYIGTTNDGNTYKLTVSGNGYNRIFRIYDGTNTTSWVSFNSGSLWFGINVNNAGNEAFVIRHSTGNVGIGTNNPAAKLDVRGNVGGTSFTGLQYTGSGVGSTNNTTQLAFYVNGEAAIYGSLRIASDARIKTNIVDVSDNSALEMVRNIPCRYYEYKDKVSRGTDNTIGFIAQEVREHLPMAVDLQREIIPNEYRTLTDISWNDTTLFTDLSDCSGVKYRFYVSNDPSGNDEIVKEVVGNADNTFTFDQSYRNVFCYGREVDDFHILDKQKLFALNFSATQEIDRIQQQEIEKLNNINLLVQEHQSTIQNQQNIIETHEEEIQTLKMFNTEANNQINQLKQENQELKQQIQYIMQHLGL